MIVIQLFPDRSVDLQTLITKILLNKLTFQDNRKSIFFQGFVFQWIPFYFLFVLLLVTVN